MKMEIVVNESAVDTRVRVGGTCVLAPDPKRAAFSADVSTSEAALRPAPISPRYVAFCLATACVAPNAWSQTSLAPMSPSGQTVTPVFKGWHRNADGTSSISFGYLNRNGTEQMQVPIGDSNCIAPDPANQGQPTAFAPRRRWGVLAVVVPADFGTNTVVWTLKDRGKTFAIPGTVKPDREIDAIRGEASAYNQARSRIGSRHRAGLVARRPRSGR